MKNALFYYDDDFNKKRVRNIRHNANEVEVITEKSESGAGYRSDLYLAEPYEALIAADVVRKVGTKFRVSPNTAEYLAFKIYTHDNDRWAYQANPGDCILQQLDSNTIKVRMEDGGGSGWDVIFTIYYNGGIQLIGQQIKIKSMMAGFIKDRHLESKDPIWSGVTL